MEQQTTKNSTVELISLVREGDQSAFPRLLQLYEPLLGAEVYHHTMGIDADEAEDFRQVALLAFYRAVLGFDLEQKEVEFGLYAKICISNALASQLRSTLRRLDQTTLVDRAQQGGDHSEGDPALRVMQDEAAAQLHTRIRSLLSPFENNVWALYMAGLSAKEIGERLGKDTHSIENAIYRIRCKLRKKLSRGY